jgi:hypothetical protein
MDSQTKSKLIVEVRIVKPTTCFQYKPLTQTLICSLLIDARILTLNSDPKLKYRTLFGPYFQTLNFDPIGQCFQPGFCGT